MESTTIFPPKITINPELKSNPNDPFIQKKVQQATDILNSLKEPQSVGYNNHFMNIQSTSQIQAFILLFKTMPQQTRKEFAEWIVEHSKTWENSAEQEDSDFWLAASSEALGQTWGDPAEDIWDEIYKKHKADGRLQAI